MHLLIQLQNSNWLTKNNKKMLTLSSFNKLLVHKLQSVHPKQIKIKTNYA